MWNISADASPRGFLKGAIPLSAQPIAVSQQVASELSRIRLWIHELSTRFHVGIPGIAKKSGVSSSTIYRWLNEDTTAPDLRSLVRISNAFGIGLPTDDEGKTTSDVSEGDVQRYDSPAGTTLATSPHQSNWIVRNRSLDLAGYLPGDVLRLDTSVAPMPGDIVFAQVYNLDTGSADTLMRIYSPPYLVGRSTDPVISDRPLYVDNERVAILGTVVSLTRERAPS